LEIISSGITKWQNKGLSNILLRGYAVFVPEFALN